MYLYFDPKGVLLEVINDEALRQYNYDVNTMYVYIENSPTTELPDGLTCLQYWFERPNGDETEVYSTIDHPGDEIVTETIPMNSKRDLQKFKYGVQYKMFKIRTPSGKVIGQDDDGNDVYEYNIFEDPGPVSLSIKAIYEKGVKELTLGKVVFTIEQEVVIPSDSISVSQFEYLLRVVETAATDSKNYNKLNNKPSINDVTLQGNKTAEDLGLVPINLKSFRSLATPPTKTFRQSAEVFVSDNGVGFRMTLQQVKDMSTKIVTAKNVSEVDFSKLDIDDYIYTEN